MSYSPGLLRRFAPHNDEFSNRISLGLCWSLKNTGLVILNAVKNPRLVCFYSLKSCL